jgi:hypothetical protein
MTNIEFITGNYKANIRGTLNEEQRAKADEAAVRYIVQRDGATKTYLDLVGVENEKGNKVLPKGFERDSLDFSDDSAEAFAASMKKALAPYGDFDVSVSQHVKGETASPMKRATAFVDELLKADNGQQILDQLVTLYGKKPSTDRETLIAYAHELKLGKS